MTCCLFADGEFDLVLEPSCWFQHRGGGPDPRPGGTFLTQQVHGLWAYDSAGGCVLTPKPMAASDPGKVMLPQLKAAGLTIADTRELVRPAVVHGCRRIVYYLKAVPWLVPGFSVKTHVWSSCSPPTSGFEATRA